MIRWCPFDAEENVVSFEPGSGGGIGLDADISDAVNGVDIAMHIVAGSRDGLRGCRTVGEF